MNLQDKNMLIERYARGRESLLIERYIKDGPADLSEQLGITPKEWKALFDHLVFEYNLLYKTVISSADFFSESYIKYGMAHIRDILDINDEAYDISCEQVFDFLAMTNDGVYYHVLEHRDRYLMAFKARGGDFVRKVLGLWKKKYDGQWEKILDFLLNSCCEALFSGQTLEHGLRSFLWLINAQREHRAVEKSEIARKGLA